MTGESVPFNTRRLAWGREEDTAANKQRQTSASTPRREAVCMATARYSYLFSRPFQRVHSFRLPPSRANQFDSRNFGD